jgi:Na+/melibiose symporter-like transporter
MVKKMMKEIIAKHEFIELGKKLELWGTLLVCLGVISISTGILARIIFKPLPPLFPDYLRVFLTIGFTLTILGIIITYYTLKWIKNNYKKTEKELKKAKENQKTELKKTLNEYIEHYGNQLLKGAISFASTAAITFAYAWIAVHNLFRQYSDYDVFLSLIIVTACLATTAVLIVYGQYWRNRAQKQNIT